MLIMPFGFLRFLRESCLLYAFLLGYLPSIFLRFFLQNLLTFICRTLYLILYFEYSIIEWELQGLESKMKMV